MWRSGTHKAILRLMANSIRHLSHNCQRSPPMPSSIPAIRVKSNKANTRAKREEIMLAELPCRWRGDELRKAKCNTCGSGKDGTATVYACEKHGECTVLKQNTQIKDCNRCKQREDPPIETILRFDPVEVWAIGVTVAPRKNPTIENTLQLLVANGWHPIVFVEPDTQLPKRRDYSVVRNTARRGAWHNWLHGARYLLANTRAERILMFQDDAVVHPETRRYLDEVGRADGIRSLYTPHHKQRDVEDGWYTVQTRNHWGAVALEFTRDILERILITRAVVDWHGFKPKKTPKNRVTGIDTVLGFAAAEARIPFWYSKPSPCSHGATHSTINHGGNSPELQRYPAGHLLAGKVRGSNNTGFPADHERCLFAQFHATRPARADIGVVVPFVDDGDLITACLDHVHRSEGVSVEVVAIDNGTGTQDPLDATVIRNADNVGFSRAVNQGIRRFPNIPVSC